MHDILMITYNRPVFTRLALEQLLRTCDDQMRVWLWHNGTDPETLAVVHDLKDHPSVHSLQVCEENKKLREPTNWFWANADGDYLSKVDDDCLLPEGWGASLRHALDDAPSLGLVACWRFYDEDFLPEAAEPKIKELPGGHRLMTHHHVQGSGYVMKRAVLDEAGPIRDTESFTHYCWRVAASGWDVGWYFPFIHEEHMDDARSAYYPYHSDEAFLAKRPLTAISKNITSLAEWRARSHRQARILQTDTTPARNLIGWRGLVRRLTIRLRQRIRRPGMT
ncbi:glycosyltransferase [Spiribacter vilamensis]|uniref:Glycosyltransferase involved in cell wall biosynthesis n=1 Tax=Spiribacter vilamensis TaxID=531306 RepID=A0A4Q8CZA5_9GAMM|nr:glycosyltransferase [Spiribacter vilamensis]RZU98356.1 glycosyltransferase involved in cell wall biosynthesis [Spiribacter vilamensis]